MIEVLNTPPKEIKGTNANGNYHFFVQKARLTSYDRDGLLEIRNFEVNTKPGEAYVPGDDYLIDPESAYIGKSQNGRDRLMLQANVRLVRASDVVNATKAQQKAA